MKREMWIQKTNIISIHCIIKFTEVLSFLLKKLLIKLLIELSHIGHAAVNYKSAKRQQNHLELSDILNAAYRIEMSTSFRNLLQEEDLRLTPNQNLPFNNIPRWSECMLNVIYLGHAKTRKYEKMVQNTKLAIQF